MENASKALIMAGGVLIAMAIIGLAMFAYMSASDFAQANEDALSISQIESFNRFYTAYITTYSGTNRIKCVDALNILNRAVEDDVKIILDPSITIISKNNGFYVADPTQYMTEVSYEVSFVKDIGIVGSVRIY